MEIGILSLEIGSIILHIENDFLIKVELIDDILEERECGIFTKQFKEYLEGKRKNFELKVKINSGPTFKKIWKHVQKIPYGSTKTYGEIAKELNVNPRVVGFAMAGNPLPIYIPCHRVVGKNDLRGFSGGIKWKKYLLALEKK
ncbi:MAG: methylated-DNA--[protein]-cysteine S-methyltransferase [Thermosipho sp. (in: Bacteria)]|nr:methylated-DNA--[protein]-cysteine S-methyltransferase [Thermosipho sp. (in: thermotogales)]